MQPCERMEIRRNHKSRIPDITQLIEYCATDTYKLVLAYLNQSNLSISFETILLMASNQLSYLILMLHQDIFVGVSSFIKFSFLNDHWSKQTAQEAIKWLIASVISRLTMITAVA